MTKEEAIKEIKSWDFLEGKEIEAIQTLVPELRESKDEKIRKALIQEFKEKVQKSFEWKDGIPNNAVLDWLEKQKEPLPIPDKFSGLKSLMLQYLQSAANRKDDSEIESDTDLWGRKILDYVWKYDDRQKEQEPISFNEPYNPDDYEVIMEGNATSLKQKEQKPTSTEDIPYITDEHFYEREPADSFKYKLAEYMTKCCTKKEGPYGYTYGISAEAILKMAEEELLKRGVVQKSAEWSEEDDKMLQRIIRHTESEYQDWCNDKYGNSEIVSDGKRSCLERLDWLENRLKSLRPQSHWKPSEEQMEAMEFVIKDYREDGCIATANYLQEILEQIKKL